MNPKDKAYELFIFYYRTIKYAHTNKERANISVLCAIRVVDEVIRTKAIDMWMGTGLENDPKYWDEVKQEILNLI